MDNNTRVKETLKEKTLEMHSMDNMYLFADRFEEKLSKIVTAKQKSKYPSSLAYMDKAAVMLWIVDPFGRALYHSTNKGVEGEDSCLQEQLTEEVNLYLKNENF